MLHIWWESTKETHVRRICLSIENAHLWQSTPTMNQSERGLSLPQIDLLLAGTSAILCHSDWIYWVTQVSGLKKSRLCELFGAKMLCRKAKKSRDEKPQIVPHPDGGWGWLVCMATFCTQFIVLGTMNNFGVIYVGLLKEFNAGKAEAGWYNFSLSSLYQAAGKQNANLWVCFVRLLWW